MENKKTRIEKVNVNLLHSGLAYQRKVTDMDRIKDIASKWDFKQFDFPCVSFRDGMYNVIDGQHTIAAYKMRFGGDSEISCKVSYGLTTEEESKWFYDEIKKSKKQSLNAEYNARLHAKDKSLLMLMEDLKQCDLLLGININTAKNVIKAIKSIEKIHNDTNSIDFITCYKLLKNTWGGDSESLKESFLKGMLKFYNTYKGEFDEERFIKSLSKVNAMNIKSKADSDTYFKDVPIKYARVFVESYNKGLKKSPLLKISKLED